MIQSDKPTRIKRVLIANRGEIACRIAASAHRLGIETVAVCSEADRNAKHVRVCDHAIEIGPASASESYLRIDKIVGAATLAGADAIHPGYGFLAENADFARAVIEAGLTFVGPPADVIDKLGSKRNAAELAEQAGIPLIARTELGSIPARYPVMVKAALGGGGKGMSIARSDAELKEAIESGKRIAESAFGSSDLLIEEYIEGARHIEVQILADSLGNVVHLGERECSIQRRHQKVIEEAPAPGLPSETRRAMTDAAVRLAELVGYRSAGTVEMILAPDGRFFFLEVNTRLQVEHAVTEMTTGIDIVAEQLRVASGAPLSFSQADVSFHGAAIEARVYAEDPVAGDLPQVGTIAFLREPESDARVDSGLVVGQRIGIDYDPMLSKVIAHGATRHEAQRKLLRALGETVILGVSTNRSALISTLNRPDFSRAELDTSFWKAPAEPSDDARERAAIAATLWTALDRSRENSMRQSLPQVTPGFRLGGPTNATNELSYRGTDLEIGYRFVERASDGSTFEVTSTGEAAASMTRVWAMADSHQLTLWDSSGARHLYWVACDNEKVFVSSRDTDWTFALAPRFGDSRALSSHGNCAAPMPGRVMEVRVAIGDDVVAGQPLLILEAMKMEHPVVAPHDGQVTALNAKSGQQVDADFVLAVVAPLA